MVIRRILCLLFLFSFLINVRGQLIPFDNYTIQNGLPQNTVNAICQDRQGYIWFATQLGAARYDGYEFDHFTTSNGLPDNFVNCLLVDRQGHVWLGTEGGLAEYSGTGFTCYLTGDGLVNNRIDDLVEDGSGNIWAVTAYGISVITPDTIIAYSKEDALTDNSVVTSFADSRGRVYFSTFPVTGLTVFEDPYTYEKQLEEDVICDIVEDVEGNIWYATQGSGIRISSGANSRWLGYSDGLEDEIVLSLMVDHRGRVWCGTYVQGLFVYDHGSFSRVSTGGAVEPVASEIFEDSHHRIWISTFEDGIWMEDRGMCRYISSENNLVHDIVTDITEDKFGNIWLATLGGASKYGRVIFEIFDTEHGLPENNVTAIYHDSRGRTWCGTYYHLLYLRGNRIYQLGETKGFMEGNTPLSFAEDAQRNIYIGTDIGLLYHNGRSIQQVTFNGRSTEDYQFFSLLYTRDHDLWCATDLGIFIYRNGRAVVPADIEKLAHPRVNDLELVGDTIYCATEDGITLFSMEGQYLAGYTTDDSLSSNVCLDLASDPSGNVWVATDRGLSVIMPGGNPEVIKIRNEDGPVFNTTYFVECADSTHLWVGTERGVCRIDSRSGVWDFYGYDDGFYPLETNARAVSGGKNGELWIGTIAGLVHYLPKYDIKDPVPPELILFPPLVDGEIYMADPESKTLKPAFPYNRNSLEFNFTGIHTTVPTKNRFSFILEGFDDGWSPPGTDRSVPYKKIPNGNYVFKVKAFNLDGAETKAEASFAFSIKPPFWKTFWFILIQVMLGLALVYGTIKYRERQLIKEKRVLEARVRERTREIEDQKVEIEAQRDEIFAKNKEITDSIQYARHIQQAVLPSKLMLEKVLPDHFILFRPRDIVSGDFYWVEQKNEHVFVCAADCTGHGVPGAFMSLLGLTFLNEIVNREAIVNASEILNHLRGDIINAMSHQDRQARDGMDICLLVIDRKKHLAHYAGAFNPLVLVRGGEINEYRADRMPIGKHEEEVVPFTNNEIKLKEGDMLYLFSDGFPDQFGGESGSKYKARPFKRLLQRIGNEETRQQKDMLKMELNTWMGAEEQVDDILVMGIRYHKQN
jgi:ligand-binding sensor domain-containing protein/serine phosphatase RsbU (regulator of sigma subunit)